MSRAGRCCITLTVHAMLSARPVHLTLSAREDPASGTWRYNLADATDKRAHYGRITGMTGHMDALRYAARVCAAGYQPGTPERRLLEQFAESTEGQCSPDPAIA